MKEYIEFIKKLWNNKRTRSLAILILYIIFFSFVFLLLNSSSTSLPTPPAVSVDPFEYLKNEEVYKIEFIGPHVFVYENENIYYNDIIYKLDERPEELLVYDLLVFNSSNIYSLISSAVLESTNYVAKSNTYVISSKDFESIIYNNSVEIDSNIRITIYEENLKEILIDLEEYYGYNVKIYLRS